MYMKKNSRRQGQNWKELQEIVSEGQRRNVHYLRVCNARDPNLSNPWDPLWWRPQAKFVCHHLYQTLNFVKTNARVALKGVITLLIGADGALISYVGPSCQPLRNNSGACPLSLYIKSTRARRQLAKNNLHSDRRYANQLWTADDELGRRLHSLFTTDCQNTFILISTGFHSSRVKC